MISQRVFLTAILFLAATSQAADNKSPFARDNLVAWCIVPFDGKKRGPAERAEMVKRLGLRRVAYDWRKEHVPTFEQEILQYKKHGIEYFAFWSVHEEAFQLFEKHGLKPQIWRTLGSPSGEAGGRVAAAAKAMLPIVQRTRKLGGKLGLYNHGGWGGEPENMVAVCKYLREHHDADHVGIVYNLHHGHGHIDDFADVLSLLKPYLLCLNLNGMTTGGDKKGRKILPLGEGEHDVALLKTIQASGYRGPIGIIGHTQDDVEQRLQDNLDGLDWILPQLSGKPAGPKPKLRTWSPKRAAASAKTQSQKSKQNASVRVAGIVLKWLRTNKAANYSRAEKMIREAAASGAKIVCTTECFLDGYAIADKSIPLEAYRDLGEPIPDGKYFGKLCNLADELDIHLIAGMLEADGKDRFNTAVIIAPDGKLIGRYHKQHLGHESVRNTAGSDSTVFETKYGKVGTMICADRRFPKIVKGFCDRGADFLICPSGGMFGPKTNDPILQARSRENEKYIVFVHPAEFLVTGPDGKIIDRTILGDRLLIEPDQVGKDADKNRVFYFDLPLEERSAAR